MSFEKLVAIIFTVILASCKETISDQPSAILDSGNSHIIIDQQKYDESWTSLQTDDPESDPFKIKSLSHDSTVLIIEVAYGGGCEDHSFELIWPEVITMIYPPRFTVLLNHNAHNDLCEAYLSQTLYFDISVEDIGISPEDMEVIDLTIINGSNGDESFKLIN